MFNYVKKGFRYKPTSYYSRPLWVRKYSTRTQNPNRCQRGRPIYKTSFDNVKLFLQRMNEDQNSNKPYFFLNFLTEYTHDDFVVPSFIDKKFKEMIENFEKLGYLDNTLLFVFSDHGSRLASYAYKTETGAAEKNLPFVSMRLPKKLWNTRYHLNAEMNKNKLVTAFDLYQTLRQFYHINANYSNELDEQQFKLNDKNIRQLRGISLFEEIPINRSCSDAFIPDMYCSCYKETIIKEDDFFMSSNSSFNIVSNFLLENVNKLTKDVRKKCLQFKFDKFQRLSQSNLHDVYKFVFILTPGNAWFQTVLKINRNAKNLKEIFTIYDHVVRISPYGNQSHCIDDSVLRNFCYCSDLLRLESI